MTPDHFAATMARLERVSVAQKMVRAKERAILAAWLLEHGAAPMAMAFHDAMEELDKAEADLDANYGVKR